ncbi:MAG: hypothetical protein IJK67_06405 [Bacilli bacterium]|nr:hypothetical protein [Bacilli bacterium]
MNLIIKSIKHIILTLLIILFILNINIILSSTKEASILFFNKVFISIFPFIILSDILIYYDYHIFLKNTIGKFISKLFNIDPNTSIIFIISMLTSAPTNAVIIKNMLDNNEIDINTANKIINYTYFPSISFVVGVIGASIYKSLKIGLILWSCCLFYNILIGIYLRKEKIIENTKKINIIKKDNFFNMLKSSILKGINTSIIILGNLIIFTIIINIIKEYIDLNPIIMSLISGVFEMTSGIIDISNLNINGIYKLIMTLFILTFSSLSIIFQSKSILSDYKINIKRTLIIKLVFSIIILNGLWIILHFS